MTLSLAAQISTRMLSVIYLGPFCSEVNAPIFLFQTLRMRLRWSSSCCLYTLIVIDC